MKIQSMTVGKSRKLRRGRDETWLRCEVVADFSSQPSEEQVNELLSVVEETLQMEEHIELERWNAAQNQFRKQ